MNKFSISLFLSIICGMFNPAQAQSDDDIRKQIWIDINPSYYFNPNTEIFADIGVRKEIENDGWLRYVFRPSFRIRIGGRSHFYAGIGNFYTFNETIEDRWELRPFQGISYIWPYWKIPLHHYIRFEERFDYNTKTWQSKNSLRIRYKLNFSYRWSAIQPGRSWRATASGEAFYTLLGEQGQFQEQARVTLGLDRSYTYDLHFRFEITWQKERRFFNTNESISDIYIRVRFNKAWGNLD